MGPVLSLKEHPEGSEADFRCTHTSILTLVKILFSLVSTKQAVVTYEHTQKP